MRSGKLYWPNSLLKSRADPARKTSQRSPSTQNMPRSLLRLAACAGLFVSLGFPSALRSQAAFADMKRYGRVGDSPIIGVGTYANNLSCAVSGTGDGEFFICDNVAKRRSGLTLVTQKA